VDAVVIRNGTVVDGTGSPGRRADVTVADGVIAEIGEDLSGALELDATGCVVAPGFIDIHTHYDAQVFWDPSLTPSSWHGVTTVVAGNCGFSIAPLRNADRDLMVDTLRVVEDMDGDTLREGVPWDAFETYAEYLDAIAVRGVRLNFAGYVGHTAVRIYTMGDDAFERAATADEIVQMQEIVRAAIRAGALGVSSSSSPGHRGAGGRPVPSRLADLDELLALVEPLRDEQRGVVAILAGERISYGDVFTVQAHAGRPLTWTPLLVMPGFDHDTWLARNGEARARGQTVWAQTAVRPIVFQENLLNPFTLPRFAAFAELSNQDGEARARAYADPTWRAKAAAEIEGAEHSLDWETVTIAESEHLPALVGRSLPDVARERGTSPLETMLDIALGDDLRTRFGVAVANWEPHLVGPIMQTEGVLLGLADSGAHVGQLCDACFATDLLGTWTRDRGVFSVEAAVHKLTGEPAAFLGLRDRGVLAPGMAADICVFDPDTVAPGPLRRVRDFPADGERLVADRSRGIQHVLVNGHLIRRDGEEVDVASRPGTVLRSHRDP
jgi:N-acyl-D-aspartate/D-glutamate deacylase